MLGSRAGNSLEEPGRCPGAAETARSASERDSWLLMQQPLEEARPGARVVVSLSRAHMISILWLGYSALCPPLLSHLVLQFKPIAAAEVETRQPMAGVSHQPHPEIKLTAR